MKAISNLKFCLITILIFAASVSMAQRKAPNLELDSVFIYRFFNDHGTTAGLWSNHARVASEFYELTKLNTEDLETLQSFVSNIKSKKLSQMKYGGEICYLLVYSNDISVKFVAGSNDSFFFLDDLGRRRSWQSKNPAEVELLTKMINKYWR
jgi:hypothetical protein